MAQAPSSLRAGATAAGIVVLNNYVPAPVIDADPRLVVPHRISAEFALAVKRKLVAAALSNQIRSCP